MTCFSRLTTCHFLARLDEVQEELLLLASAASTFRLKFFKSLYFPDHLIDLVHISCDDRYSSKVLFSNTTAHHLKVKVRSRSWTFLMLKIFKSSYFPNYMMDFVHIWYDDGYSSKVLFSNTPAHAYDLMVTVTDLKVLK